MEEKKTLKEWFTEKKAKISKFCEDHPDVVFTVIGGFASLAGGCLKLYASKSDYDDHLYTTVEIDGSNQIYKLPAKHMKTSMVVRGTIEEKAE